MEPAQHKRIHWLPLAVAGAGGGVIGAGLAIAALAWVTPLGQALRLPVSAEGLRQTLLAHPEILPEALESLKAKEAASHVAQYGPKAAQPFPGAVLGNPQGRQVLVEFMDFACTFCKASEADLARLMAANPQLKIVLRQLPILSEQSSDAAQMALVAAKQGKYAAFHHAMFAQSGLDKASIARAAQSAGVDLALAQAQLADKGFSAAIKAELEANLALARAMGITGTPSFVAGDKLLDGAVGFDNLQAAVAQMAEKSGGAG